MSSSNCCFLTCIQVSQEAGQVVWYHHLFQNFPQFIVIHTVKGFGIVNKAEIDVFLELSCFFDDPAYVSNLISGSSAFSKTSLMMSPYLADSDQLQFLLFSRKVMSNFLRLYELQHARLPCPSLSPIICSNSCPTSVADLKPDKLKYRVQAQSFQSCLTLCNPLDCSPPGFSVHEIPQQEY